VFAKIVFALICFTCLFTTNAHSQQQIDTELNRYSPSADSIRALDSAYLARRAELYRWAASQRGAVHSPQDDFLSIYAEYGGYMRVLPRDLNQYFSERSLRPDPMSDRNMYGDVDREIIVGGQAQLTQSWGIYVEYDFTAKFSNTIIDSNFAGLLSAEEELDLYEHSLVVGGMVIIYSGPFYRLRADGGFGAVYALTSETESTSGATRSASAIGNQVNFDLLNDFRIMPHMSFTLDLLFRTVTTGALKTSGGETLDTQFGVRTLPLSIPIQPTASNVVYGAAAGIVYYF
jgi:hypothetical protein